MNGLLAIWLVLSGFVLVLAAFYIQPILGLIALGIGFWLDESYGDRNNS